MMNDSDWEQLLGEVAKHAGDLEIIEKQIESWDLKSLNDNKASFRARLSLIASNIQTLLAAFDR